MSRYQKFESELVLVITDKIEDTARDIAELRSLLDYDLTRRHSRIIRDTYYDTPDGTLRRKKISFRTRKSRNSLLVSVKSKPARVAGSGIGRLEIERPLTLAAIRTIGREIGLEGIREKDKPTLSKSPANFFAKIGLEVVQERTTRRKSRDIVERARDGRQVFAELDIDDVTYKLNSGRVRLLEVEIEAKTEGAMARIRRVSEALLTRYPESLRLWGHGKFVTGLAIERLLESGRLKNLTSDSLLNPEAFDLVDRVARTSASQSATR